MDNILTATGVIGAIIFGSTQLIKQVVPDNKWLPILNVVIGIFIGLAYAYTMVGGELAVYAWAGAISGLGAGGFYDLQANVRGLNNQRKSNNLINDGLGEQDLTNTFEQNEDGE